MICIYHNRDLDGYASGAIVKRKYPDVKLIGYDYGQQLPYNLIPKGEPIIMIDVSLKMPEMLELAKYSNFQLTWIDHHVSTINDYKNFVGEDESFMNAILENGISACEGGWKYLFPNEEMPIAISLLGEYDTWRNQNKKHWEEKILPFQFGMRLYCNSPESFPQDVFNNSENSFIEETIIKGNTVLLYQSQVNETQCKKAAFEIEFEGMRAICLNGGGFNSDVFKSIYNESKHDIMMPFQFDGKQWIISLYTTKDEVDCSVIAKLKGGGGHKKAAGFQVKEIGSIFSNLKHV